MSKNHPGWSIDTPAPSLFMRGSQNPPLGLILQVCTVAVGLTTHPLLAASLPPPLPLCPGTAFQISHMLRDPCLRICFGATPRKITCTLHFFSAQISNPHHLRSGRCLLFCTSRSSRKTKISIGIHKRNSEGQYMY